MTHYVCIHGHFYQPPREDPYTGIIPTHPSAAPFDNWNVRILKECYMANTNVEIVDSQGQFKILNCYDFISFNIGPTLFSWMEQFHPQTTHRILESHHRSVNRTGHSNSIAQAYHHSILPLATRYDKETEIRWGIADYEHRFGMKPEGMWLAETAVDTETLEVLSECGIRFVILAARQAKAIEIAGDWQSVNEETLDTSQAYQCELPSGQSIALFFYEPQLAMDVAFRGALNNGVDFASKIVGLASQMSDNHLLHFATDGESYGHHHRHGEVALGFCLDRLHDSNVEITNYGAYLAKHPPVQKAQIVENSSWSCAHGVGRWSTNCGCVIDPAMKGQQEWRVDLRRVLSRLDDIIRTLFMDACSDLLSDPMEVRHRWKAAELSNTTKELIAEFLHPRIKLTAEHFDTIQFWMKGQELSLKMFTSCGWFFDSYTGIEAQQILAYADRLIHHTAERVEWDFAGVIRKEFLALFDSHPR